MKLKKLVAFALVAALALCMVACSSGVTLGGVSLDEVPELKVGETFELTALFTAEGEDAETEAIEKAVEKLEIAWASSKEEVALVDELGVIAAVGAGEADITLTVGELSATITIKVVDPVADFEIADFELTLGGEAVAIEPVLTPVGAVVNEKSFVVADEAIAKVEDEKLVAVAVGETELKVMIDGIEKTVKVVVVEAEEDAEPAAAKPTAAPAPATQTSGGTASGSSNGGNPTSQTPAPPAQPDPAPAPAPAPSNPEPAPAPAPSGPVLDEDGNVDYDAIVTAPVEPGPSDETVVGKE